MSYLKNYVLNNCSDLLKEVNHAKFLQYAEGQLKDYGVIVYDKFRKLDDAPTLETLYQNNSALLVKTCEKINHANANRSLRLAKRIRDIISNSLANDLFLGFVTFTFKDSFIDKTTFNTRRTYIQRVLKKTCCQYVANVDYGESEEGTHREHYHAVVSSRDISALERIYKSLTGSYIYIEKIRLLKSDIALSKKLSKYVSKLANHALKESAKSLTRFIYDRNKSFKKS